jgi:hypothetical protein
MRCSNTSPRSDSTDRRVSTGSMKTVERWTVRRLEIPVRRRGPRIRVFCTAYGVDATPDLLDVVERRIKALYDSARAWGEAGAAGWSDVWRETRGEQWLRSLRFVEEQRADWVD